MRRARTLRTWQGATPANIQHRIMYEIAERNTPRFARAWLQGHKNLSKGADLGAMEKAIRQNDDLALGRAIPALRLDRKSPELRKLIENFQKAYIDVIDQSAEAEFKRQNFTFKSFSIENPYSFTWIAARAGALIKEYITDPQIEILRNMLDRSFAAQTSAAPRKLARQMLQTMDLGLTARQEAALNRQFVALLNDGVSEAAAIKQLRKRENKMRKSRALTIARTETLEAEARGVLDSWRVAQDAGLFPEGMQKEWIAAQAVGPNPPCQICAGLDGTIIPLDAEFEIITGSSSFFKAGPTAHPNCRCTIAIVYPESGAPDGPFSAEDFEIG